MINIPENEDCDNLPHVPDYSKCKKCGSYAKLWQSDSKCAESKKTDIFNRHYEITRLRLRYKCEKCNTTQGFRLEAPVVIDGKYKYFKNKLLFPMYYS